MTSSYNARVFVIMAAAIVIGGMMSHIQIVSASKQVYPITGEEGRETKRTLEMIVGRCTRSMARAEERPAAVSRKISDHPVRGL